MQTVKVNANTKEVSAYVADFTVELKGKRTNGSYPVILKVTARDTKGNAVEQEFTTYVTISDGIDPDATTEEVKEPATEELPTFAPKVMVKSYKYSKSEIQPGDEIKADIVLLNTSKENTVKNMTIAVLLIRRALPCSASPTASISRSWLHKRRQRSLFLTGSTRRPLPDNTI